MKVLVVTSCTASKANKSCKARDMYLGLGHLKCVEGINLLQKNNVDVDLYILSFGKGLVNENTVIDTYNVDHSHMTKSRVSEMSDNVNIYNDINNIIDKYDIAIFLLGKHHIEALKLPFKKTKPNEKIIFFTPSNNNIPKDYTIISAGNAETKLFSYGSISLKGYMFNLLCREIIASDKKLLTDIYNNPYAINSALEKYKKPSILTNKQKGFIMIE